MLKSSFTHNLLEAGCDEVGRGCLAGPVVAGAVVFPKKYRNREIKDSKQLSKKRRTELCEVIKRDSIAYSVAEVSSQEIDEINILNASIKAMHLAVKQLSPQPELLLIDGNRFWVYKSIPHKCIVAGDTKYLSIAAASILAKTYRDEYMQNMAIQYQQYHWESNMGYPTKAHREGIKKWGISPLHRRSFSLLKADT